MEAAELRMVDQDFWAHWKAFLNFAVKAERKAGKGKSRPVYSKFPRFYNYEKEIENVKNKKRKKTKLRGIGKLLEKGG